MKSKNRNQDGTTSDWLLFDLLVQAGIGNSKKLVEKGFNIEITSQQYSLLLEYSTKQNE